MIYVVYHSCDRIVQATLETLYAQVLKKIYIAPALKQIPNKRNFLDELLHLLTKSN